MPRADDEVIDLGLGCGDLVVDALGQAVPCIGNAHHLGDGPDLLTDDRPAAGAVEDDHRDARVLELQLHLERPDAVVGEHQGRVELQDRLGVELVPVVGHERQFGQRRHTGGHVPSDQPIAQAQRVHRRRQGAVGVECQDP